MTEAGLYIQWALYLHRKQIQSFCFLCWLSVSAIKHQIKKIISKYALCSLPDYVFRVKRRPWNAFDHTCDILMKVRCSWETWRALEWAGEVKPLSQTSPSHYYLKMRRGRRILAHFSDFSLKNGAVWSLSQTCWIRIHLLSVALEITFWLKSHMEMFYDTRILRRWISRVFGDYDGGGF